MRPQQPRRTAASRRSAPVSPNGHRITDAYWLILGITGAVFLVVEGTLLTFVIRYRRRGRPRARKFDQTHGATRLEAMWTIGPVILLAIVVGFVFYKLPGIKNARGGGGDPLNVRVEAHQFYWLFKYPDGRETINALTVPVDGSSRSTSSRPTSRTAGGFPRSAARSTRFPARQPHVVPGRENRPLRDPLHRVLRRPAHRDERRRQRRSGGAGGAHGKRRPAGLHRRVRLVPRGLEGEGLIGPAIAASPTLQDPARLRNLIRHGQRQMPAVGKTWDAALMKQDRSRTSASASEARVAVDTAPPVVRPSWYEGRFARWLVTTDHKRIGLLYISTSLVFFVGGGILALLMRGQLATPNEDFITGDSYNELFTIHGTTMVFLVVVPILAGFANFLVPLMIGAHDVAFPRLNAMSYWFFLFGGVTLFMSFLAGGGAAKCGWTCYAPLSEPQYSPGHGVDLWILSLHLLTIASLAGAINFIATIHNMRTKGMTWMRLPLFVLGDRGLPVMLVIVLPALAAGLTALLLDRHAGTHSSTPRKAAARSSGSTSSGSSATPRSTS